jgi:DNA-binding NarL/FixJ family response regulator
MSGVLRVVIADDHAPTRAGVRDALDGAGFVVVAEAHDAPTAIEAALREQPDVCLLDIHMPGNGIAAATTIGERLPDAAVVMLTVSRDDDDLFASLKAGAMGYLPKDMDPERLAAALRGVLDGEAAVPRALVARVLREFRTAERKRSLPFLKQRGIRLTAREHEVLEMLHGGLSTGEIAHRIGRSPVTVRRHVSAMLAKLQVPDREAMTRLLDEHAAA